MIYIAVLGIIALGFGIWSSYLLSKNHQLKLKADQSELDRVEAEGVARQLILKNEQLYQELKECKRQRDNKGRYIKK